MTIQRCTDFDEDCPSIKAEGYCLRCWLHDPSKGWCPYLMPEPMPEKRSAETQEAGQK